MDESDNEFFYQESLVLMKITVERGKICHVI